MRDAAKTDLLNSTTMPRIDLRIGAMTPAERARGRYMRAPDHDGGDPVPSDPPADPPADPTLADPLADPPVDGDPESLMTPKDGDPPADPEADPVAELPEKYEITPPEGLTIDEALMAEADPIFRDLKLDNNGANKLMPLASKFADRLFSAQNDAFEAQAADWAKQAKADPEIGGQNWAETETLVARAFDTAATGLGEKGAEEIAKFKTLLGTTKLGNHPTMIRMFRYFGKAVGEDPSLVRGDAGAQVKKSREEILYAKE